MKTLALTLCLFFFFAKASGQNIAINTTGASPHPSAVLDVQSLDKGWMGPRHTTVSKIAIVNPAPGLMVLDTTIWCISLFNGVGWINLCAQVTGLTCPAGFTNIDDRFCIEIDEHPLGVAWVDAVMHCHSLGARLCTPEEWVIACELGAPLNDFVTGPEWTSDVNSGNSITSLGTNFCENLVSYSSFSNSQYRCCFSP